VIAPEDSTYNGKPLSWLPEAFTPGLDCVHGPTGAAEAAEAQRLLMDMVVGLKRRHLTDKARIRMFIPGPNSPPGHWYRRGYHQGNRPHPRANRDRPYASWS
jgi:hypothetical protein